MFDAGGGRVERIASLPENFGISALGLRRSVGKGAQANFRDGPPVRHRQINAWGPGSRLPMRPPYQRARVSHVLCASGKNSYKKG